MVQMLRNFVADRVDLSDAYVELIDRPSGDKIRYPAPLLVQYAGDSEAMRRDRLDRVAKAAGLTGQHQAWGWIDADNHFHALGRHLENALLGAPDPRAFIEALENPRPKVSPSPPPPIPAPLPQPGEEAQYINES
jgi:hypothetical protein